MSSNAVDAPPQLAPQKIKESSKYLPKERGSSDAESVRRRSPAANTWGILRFLWVWGQQHLPALDDRATASVNYSYFTPQFPWCLARRPLLSVGGLGGFCAGISKHTEMRKREEANGTKIFSICHAEILEKKKKITHYFHLKGLCYLRLYIYFFFFFLFVSLVNDFQEGVNIQEKSKHNRF